VSIRLLFFFVLAIPGTAQDPRLLTSVKGTVITGEPLAGNRLIVNLFEGTSHKALSRSYVGADGSFEFHDVPAGTYTVELSASSGEPILNQIVNLNSSGDRIEIRLPRSENKPVGTGTVSVHDLQHPFSAKSRKIFEAAQKASATGDYLKAAGILRGALNDPAALPYARMNIGVAYMKAGQPAEAVPEMQEAVRLMPDDIAARTNLAFSLFAAKRLDAAEIECRRAVQLDRNNAKARWVMAAILLNKGSRDEEVIEHLRLASREFPQAKVILAQFYERNGQSDAAVRELREFLPQASAEDRVKVEKWLSKLSLNQLSVNPLAVK
jgi:tetratricopeptide (TPR) repeat protein